MRISTRLALVLALSFAGATAFADPPAGVGKGDHGAKDDKEHGKGDDKGGKPDDDKGKAEDKGHDVGKPDDKGHGEDHKARAAHERDEERGKVIAALKGHPMSQAFREELKRHARRVARLDRVLAVAEQQKDEAAVARAKKLLEKENARHDKWMAHYDAEKGDSK